MDLQITSLYFSGQSYHVKGLAAILNELSTYKGRYVCIFYDVTSEAALNVHYVSIHSKFHLLDNVGIFTYFDLGIFSCNTQRYIIHMYTEITTYYKTKSLASVCLNAFNSKDYQTDL